MRKLVGKPFEISTFEDARAVVSLTALIWRVEEEQRVRPVIALD